MISSTSLASRTTSSTRRGGGSSTRPSRPRRRRGDDVRGTWSHSSRRTSCHATLSLVSRRTRRRPARATGDVSGRALGGVPPSRYATAPRSPSWMRTSRDARARTSGSGIPPRAKPQPREGTPTGATASTRATTPWRARPWRGEDPHPRARRARSAATRDAIRGACATRTSSICLAQTLASRRTARSDVSGMAGAPHVRSALHDRKTRRNRRALVTGARRRGARG